MVLTIGGFRLTSPDDLKLETFECPAYRGVGFTWNGVKFEVLENVLLGPRLLISEGLGWLRDMPFHAGTAGFIPDVVRVEHAPIV